MKLSVTGYTAILTSTHVLSRKAKKVTAKRGEQMELLLIDLTYIL